MPLYEYECTSCGRRFEVLQKYSDESVSVCIHCGGPVNRLLSSTAIQFKGTGWYVTDYARKSSPSAESKSQGDGKGAEGEKPAATTSSETKETKPSEEASKSTPPSSTTKKSS